MLFLQTRTPSAAIAAWIASLVLVKVLTQGVSQFHLATNPLGTPPVVLLVPVALFLRNVRMGFGTPEFLAILARVFVVARTVMLGGLLGGSFCFGFGTTRRGRRQEGFSPFRQERARLRTDCSIDNSLSEVVAYASP